MKTIRNYIPLMILAVFFLTLVSPVLVAQQKSTKVKVEQKQKVENKDAGQNKIDTLAQKQKKTDVGKEGEKNTEVTDKTVQPGKKGTVEVSDKAETKDKSEKGIPATNDTTKPLGKERNTEAQGNAYGRNKGDLSGREFGQQRASDAKAKQTSTKEEAKIQKKGNKAGKKKNK